MVYEQLVFSDGSILNLKECDIVVFVGPNNAGKSAALRDIETLASDSSYIGGVIKSATLTRRGSVEDVLAMVRTHGQRRGHDGQPEYAGFRFHIVEQNIRSFWGTGDNDQLFYSLFVMRIGTETRITDSNPQASISVLDQAPQHPIHVLAMQDGVERKLSGMFRRAFGKDLIVFHGGGQQWPLLVGQRPVPAPGEDRLSENYIATLRSSTRPLQIQGDGMRSFATVLMFTLAPVTPSVLLLDEPEAFLHPPQAKLLGEFIAGEKPPRAQLFVATHSPDVLQGILNVASDQVRVVRMRREGDVNHIKELDKQRAKAISTDPLMKYSSVLSGVFHERVIVCEGDADCLFYSTILDLPDVHGILRPDVLFVQAGGKQRTAMLAGAMRALDVPVDVVVDIDILNDEIILQRTVEALGGDFEKVAEHSRPLKNAIEAYKPPLSSQEVVRQITGVLEKAPATGEFPKYLKGEIDGVFRKATPWDAIKAAGAQAIPAGEATQHWNKLQDICKGIGLWIVPTGEMEGFCKSIGGHGPKWVQEVLTTRDVTNDPELREAREFVKNIWEGKPT